VRAADIDGDGRAEIMGRMSDGVHTYRRAASASSWADPSASFPDLQPGAYGAISTKLGIAGGQLRTVYGDAIATLTTYQEELGDPDFLAGHDLDTSWQPSVDQLHGEVTSVIALQNLFERFQQYLLDITVSDKISLDTVATAIELSQQVKQGSRSIVADIFELLSGLGVAFSALAGEAPGMTVLAGMIESSLTFAVSLPGGQGVVVNPVVETYENLNVQLGASFNALRTASDHNEAAILADYGLLTTIGNLVTSGQWTWPVDPTPDPEAVFEAHYTLWAWQTLGAVAWTVYDAIYADNFPVPGDRSAPHAYDMSWFWWGPTTPNPYKPYSTVQHCRWLLLAAEQDYKPINVSVLHQLFDAPPKGLGVSPGDVLTNANGWAIPLGPR
jgi:hypothetical protein